MIFGVLKRRHLYIYAKKKYSAACLALKRHLGSLLQILECLRRPREGAFFSDLAADPKVF
jgi:hypothetical protein